MLNYGKLSKSTRTRTAMLLLLLFMVLAVADLFISFAGGLVLGVLLVQLEMEALRFLQRPLNNLARLAGLLKRYRNLSNDQRILLKAGLQVAVTILMLAGVVDTFWGGMISGILLALLADDLIRLQQQRIKRDIIR